jgi:2-iminoacetate synthase
MINKVQEWKNSVIKQDEIDKFLIDGKDFINERDIFDTLNRNTNPDKEYIRSIMQKSLSIETLTADETAALLHVKDEDLWQEMYEVGNQIKKKVYDNRIVFFAPLYCANLCVNSCKYCGFRKENSHEQRRILKMDEIKAETRALGNEGHKWLIMVYGEHPASDVDYMVDTINAVYSVKEPIAGSKRRGEIRRVNINAAPMETAKLRKLKDAGIGTYQVFQETYDKRTYADMHPAGPKSDYRWRLYALHRAMDAGIDDLAIGALFGLYDWRFEVMGLLAHAHDLERQFEIGPHTISFPRINPASGSDVSRNLKYQVSDEDFKKLITVLRLAVPYSGLIITARERAELRDDIINVGCTQVDASSKIGIGAYSEQKGTQEEEKQQFMLADTRSLNRMIGDLADQGIISSFCTAGYRCGRTGDKIMGLLKNCVEGKFCKLNAVLTFKEYLDDYATDRTRLIGDKLIEKEMEEIRGNQFYKDNKLIPKVEDYLGRIKQGENDLYL